MNEDLGGLAEKVELPVQLSALPTRHHHQGCGWSQGCELVDQQRRRFRRPCRFENALFGKMPALRRALAILVADRVARPQS
ncbi:hypothetical protein A5682_08945 [Mycobacterium mantenii]|nr:hypothetical protein A5682_08945 [Mycobacterium mantenii]